MSKAKYPNRDALREANDIYLDAMRPFVIYHLKQVPGKTVEDLINEALDNRQKDDFWRKLDEHDDVESAIDFSYFPLIIKEHWLIEQNRRNYGFAQRFNGDMTIQSRLWLIRDGRNSCEHRGTKDLDSEFVRINLFHITELLGKINRLNEQSEVETIRDQLFFDNTKERLAEAEKRLKEMEAENAAYKENLAEVEKHLEAAKSEKSQYETDNATLSKQIDGKEKRRKKLSTQLKSAKAENDKYKKNLAGAKQRLEKSEAARADYKERLKTMSKELKDRKKELAAVEAEKTAHQKHLKTISEELESVKVEQSTFEERLTATSNELALAQVEQKASEKYLAVARNLLTTVAIADQAIFPPLGTDAAVRIIDRRGTDKRNYLLALLEQKQPTIVYVQSEAMVDRLLTRVVPEEEDVIGRCYQQTSKAEETEILEKLENGELIAAVSSATLSTLTPAHPIEHFIFCHLVPGLEEFFKRCQPAFTSKKNTYLHLIYNNEQDIEGLNEWLAQKYPNRETLEKLYPELRQLAATNGDFIDIRSLYSELDIAKLGIETGLAIFEELQLLERNGESIKLLTPAGKTLDESETYCKGEKLKKETTDFCPFQLEHSIEQIWEKMLEELNIES